MRRRVEEIIQELLDATKKTGLDVDHESIFQEAMVCYRVEQNHTSKTPVKKPDNSQPTEKQLNLIRKHEEDFIAKGFDINNIQTRVQATKIINDWILLRDTEKKKIIKKHEPKGELYDEESSLI